MMGAMWIIAVNTYREIIRDRILYGIVVFAVLLMGLSLALAQLSFVEQARITVNFGLSATHMSCVILSIFLGSTLVFKEIEKKTVQTLLVRPVSRGEFLLGKALGLLLVQIVAITGLATVLVMTFQLYGVELNYQFFVALHGILLEAIVLLAVTMFFSIFATPFLVVPFAVGIFMIGHWLESLRYFTKGDRGYWYGQLASILDHLIPNLERFNWRPAVVYADAVSFDSILWASLSAVGWFVLLFSLSSIIFRRKDFA